MFKLNSYNSLDNPRQLGFIVPWITKNTDYMEKEGENFFSKHSKLIFIYNRFEVIVK